jgi:hypothetical protein
VQNYNNKSHSLLYVIVIIDLIYWSFEMANFKNFGVIFVLQIPKVISIAFLFAFSIFNDIIFTLMVK